MVNFARSENSRNCMECNQRLPLFTFLTSGERKILNSNRFEVCFKAGETIFKQGTSATHLIVLNSGFAKLYVEGVRNRQLIIRIISPWELIGQASLYFDNRHHYSISALSDVSACFIGISEFKQVLRMNHAFSEEFIRTSTSKGISYFEKMVSLSQKQMHGRIADGLLYLSEKIYKSNSFDLHLSRQDMADLTGMSKDSAIRILKEFDHEGVIRLKGRSLTIIKPKQLECISEKG